jgi:glycosyltransferase involved in cell wall biosynthesis
MRTSKRQLRSKIEGIAEMRIVIDMQGAQTESRFRGIGRYTISFAQAVVRNRGENEVLLALSALFPDTIELIRAAFEDLLPQENIRVWHAPGPVRECQPGNDDRRHAAELIREAFLSSLQPDVIHITSLFEGYVDDAVTSIGRFDIVTPVTAVLCDLIPLLNPAQYLASKPIYLAHYKQKVEYLRQAQVLLAISEFTRQEGLNELDLPSEKITNISAAIEPCFKPIQFDAVNENTIRKKYRITRPFILYTGGSDERKNLVRLIQAYAQLPQGLRQSNQLVLVGRMDEFDVAKLKRISHKASLTSDNIVFTGYVSDEDLVQLYNLCNLFVFPSWHEGFGLPPLEAMACGAPVICASTSSLPEVVGLDEAMFNPMDVDAICEKIAQALSDENFNQRLRVHGLQQSTKFSWNETAKRAIATWQSVCFNKKTIITNINQPTNQLIKAIAKILKKENESYLISLANCLALNTRTGIERQLLVDVSELCQRDSATGVQRVVRSYLLHLLASPPSGFRYTRCTDWVRTR